VPLPLALSFSLPLAILLCDPFVLRDWDHLSYLIWPTQRQSQPLVSIRLSLATRTHLQHDENERVKQENKVKYAKATAEWKEK
jgi:hypothetical protein